MTSFNDVPEIKKRVITENTHAYAFPTNIPVVPGHVLIVPKRAVHSIEELTLDELKSIFDLIASLKTALRKVFGATGFNHAWNEGLSAGQSIEQLHFHLLPRKEGDTGVTQYDPRKFLYRPGTRAVTPEEELVEVTKLIKERLCK